MHPRLSRRRWLAGLGGLTGAALLPAPSARGQGQRPSLYVYLHTEVKSSALEKELRSQLPGLEVTVFGRFRDFEEGVNRRRPDAVLALQPLLAFLQIPPTLQGLRGDRDWEPYVLMSEESATEGAPDARVLGVVDLLGRSGTQQLVSRLLPNRQVELRRVTKLEDLLPLLQFSAAQAVLVPAGAARGFSERSRLKLRVHPLPDARVGLPAAGVLNPAARANVLGQLQRLDAEAFRMLGIERWRATR
jgi:hypothetical protein